MNMIESLSEQAAPVVVLCPGQQLAQARETQGHSQEYVAECLHLRVKTIELLEVDAYDQLPQPVFIQGYFRAYAKLLGLAPEPFLEQYEALKAPEKKVERILRQREREPMYRDMAWRLSILIGMFVTVMCIYYGWNHHKAAQLTKNNHAATPVLEAAKPAILKQDQTLIDLSAMETTSTMPKAALPQAGETP